MSWETFNRTLGTVIEERFSNPLVTSFLLSWPIWNYKFIFILCSGEGVPETFELIEKHAYPNYWGFPYWFTIVGPLLTAYLYVWVLPHFAHPYFKKWRSNLQSYNGIKDALPVEPMLSKAEGLEMEKKFFELDTSINQLRIENRALKHDLHQATNKVEDFNALSSKVGTYATHNDELSHHLSNALESEKSVRAQLNLVKGYVHALKVKYLVLTDYVAQWRGDAAPALALIEQLAHNVNPSDYDKIDSTMLGPVDIGRSIRNHSQRLFELESAKEKTIKQNNL